MKRSGRFLTDICEPGRQKRKLTAAKGLAFRGSCDYLWGKICAMEIPRGNSREDIKARKQIINDFYANWIAEHPDKKVWNKSLHAYIHVKFRKKKASLGR